VLSFGGVDGAGSDRMNRNMMINFGLLLLVLLLAATVYFESGINQSPKKITLTQLVPSDINYIRIRDNHGRDLIMEKQQGHWWMIRPYKKTANEQRIQQLLNITTTRSFSQFKIPEVRLAEFGLTPPSIYLQLNNLVLEIGGNESIQFRRYVRIGEQMHLINNGYHHHLMAQADDFISKTKALHP